MGDLALRLRRLRAAWARVGALFPVEPASGPVDLENLLCATAQVARDDQRLFVVGASWLAMHSRFVDVPRLNRGILMLEPVSSATLGALLALAGSEVGANNPLSAASECCRPLQTPEPLFRVKDQQHH